MAAALCKREFELLNRFKGLNRKEIQPEREVEQSIHAEMLEIHIVHITVNGLLPRNKLYYNTM